jgi:hypothetical protein
MPANYAESRRATARAHRDEPLPAERAAEIDAEKRIDLASSVGAGVLGAGLGALLAAWLAPAAMVLIVVGTALHGWAMLARRQRERRAGVPLPAWALTMYWVCWTTLLALGAYLLLARR